MRHYLINAFLIVTLSGSAQTSPSIEWQKALGGPGNEGANSIVRTDDGGYALAGLCTTNGGNVTNTHGALDFWVVKLSSSGTLQWQKAFGGSGVDYALNIKQTGDQGYVVVGASGSNSGDVTGNHGDADCWVIKLNAAGDLEWQRSLGGSASDEGECILQTLDGGYIIVGSSDSNDGDVSGNHGSGDVWLIRLGQDGTLIWQRIFGGSGIDVGRVIIETGDGGYVLAGNSDSNDGDVTGAHGLDDYWLLKVSETGVLQWQRACGGSGYDRAFGLVRRSDGVLVATGDCNSNDGDVVGAHGSTDNWVIALDSTGVLEWQRPLGGTGEDYGQAIIETTYGDLIVTGGTSSSDGDVDMNHGSSDAWVVRISGTGSLIWEKTMGGSQYDGSYGIASAADGGYAIAASTSSNDGEVSGFHGSGDVWAVKLATDPTGVRELDSAHFTLWPNPARDQVNVRFDMVPLEPTRLEVHTSTGQLVRSGSMTGIERLLVLPTADLAPGSYSIRIVTNGTSTQRSFLK